MVDTGDAAPNFTAAVADGDIERFELAEHLGDGPVVLAFYPAAFSNTCTDEMCTFRDELDRFADVGGQVFGISTDLPHAQAAYRQQYDLPFPLVADADHDAIETYDVVSGWPDRGVEVVAQRAVFVVDSDGEVTYRWLAEHPGKEPDYDEVADAVADAV